MTNYYQKFIHKYADIAASLNDLLRKDAEWSWGKEQDTAFEELKKALQLTPVLKLADPDLPYRLETDASDRAIGGVLKQEHEGEWHPVAFISRKLKEAEINYHTYDRELLALVHALRKWRCYLLGLEIEAFTDHHTIANLLEQKELTGRQARWAEMLAEYHVNITYKAGTQNVVADALSRRADYIKAGTLEELPDFLEKIKASYKGDADFEAILRAKDPSRYDNPKHAEKHFPEYSWAKGILLKDGRVCVPKSMRQGVLTEYHDTPSAGHPGGRRMYLSLRQTFYWPNMKREVEYYARSCDICQKNKTLNQKKAGLLNPLPVPNACWEHIAMDFITQLPKTARGHTAVLVVVDRLSKQVHLIATRNEVTAAQAARLFLERIYANHGMPLSIVSDRDPKFTAQFWDKLMTLLGTELKMSSTRHPETDGQSERTIRTISQYLRSFVKYNQKDWDLWLPLAEFAFNSAVHSSTGMSPFQVVLGRQPLTPLAFVKAHIDSGLTEVDELLEDYQQVRKVCKRILESVRMGPFAERENVVTIEEQEARGALVKAQKRMKDQADRNRRDEEFEIGDQVLISTKDFDLNQYSSRPSRKLGPKYIGPYKVTRRFGERAYEVQLPKALGMHPTFHTSQLRKYYPPDEFKGRPLQKEVTGVVKGLKDVEIVGISDHRVKEGVRQYRVVFENGERAWVPGRNLENAHRHITNYEETLDNEVSEGEEEEEELEDRRKVVEQPAKTLHKTSHKTTLSRELKALVGSGDGQEVVLCTRPIISVVPGTDRVPRN